MIDNSKMTIENNTEENEQKIIIRLHAAQKLAGLGSSQPDIQDIPRRR